MSSNDYKELCTAAYDGVIKGVQTSNDKKLTLSGKIRKSESLGNFYFDVIDDCGIERSHFLCDDDEDEFGREWGPYEGMGLATVAFLRNHYRIARFLLDNDNGGLERLVRARNGGEMNPWDGKEHVEMQHVLAIVEEAQVEAKTQQDANVVCTQGSGSDCRELCRAVFDGDIKGVQTMLDNVELDVELDGNIQCDGSEYMYFFHMDRYGSYSKHESLQDGRDWGPYIQTDIRPPMGLAKIAFLRNHFGIAKLLLDKGARNDPVELQHVIAIVEDAKTQ